MSWQELEIPLGAGKVYHQMSWKELEAPEELEKNFQWRSWKLLPNWKELEGSSRRGAGSSYHGARLGWLPAFFQFLPRVNLDQDRPLLPIFTNRKNLKFMGARFQFLPIPLGGKVYHVNDYTPLGKVYHVNDYRKMVGFTM
jgi:hypothetical protein